MDGKNTEIQGIGMLKFRMREFRNKKHPVGTLKWEDGKMQNGKTVLPSCHFTFLDLTFVAGTRVELVTSGL